MGRWGLPAFHLWLLPSVLGVASAYASFETRLGSCQAEEEPVPQPHDDLQLEEVMRFNLLQTSSSKSGLALAPAPAGAASTPSDDGEADVARIMADRITMAKGNVPVDVPGYVTWRVASTNTAMDNNEHFLMYREGSERNSDDAWSVAHQHNTFFNKDGWDRWVLEHHENKERVRWVLERQVEEDAAAPAAADAEGPVAASPAAEQVNASGATLETPAQPAAHSASADEVPTKLAAVAETKTSGTAAGAVTNATATAEAAHELPVPAAVPASVSEQVSGDAASPASVQPVAANAAASEFPAPSATALQAAVEGSAHAGNVTESRWEGGASEFAAPSATTLEGAVNDELARAGQVTAEPLALESAQSEDKPSAADSVRPDAGTKGKEEPEVKAAKPAENATSQEHVAAEATEVLAGAANLTAALEPLANASEVALAAKAVAGELVPANATEPAIAGADLGPDAATWIVQVLSAAAEQGFKVDGSQGLASNSSDPSATQPGSPEWIAEVLAAAVNQAAALQPASNATVAASVDSTLMTAAAPEAGAAAPAPAEAPNDITDWLAQILTAAAAVLPEVTPAPQGAAQPATAPEGSTEQEIAEKLAAKLSASAENVPAVPEEPVVQQRGTAEAEQAADESRPAMLTQQANEVAASGASRALEGAAAAAANDVPTRAGAKPVKAADKRLQARLSAIEKFLGLAEQADEDKLALMQRQQRIKSLVQRGLRPAGSTQR